MVKTKSWAEAQYIIYILVFVAQIAESIYQAHDYARHPTKHFIYIGSLNPPVIHKARTTLIPVLHILICKTSWNVEVLCS